MMLTDLSMLNEKVDKLMEHMEAKATPLKVTQQVKFSNKKTKTTSGYL